MKGIQYDIDHSKLNEKLDEHNWKIASFRNSTVDSIVTNCKLSTLAQPDSKGNMIDYMNLRLVKFK
jgi:hypothetical protein